MARNLETKLSLIPEGIVMDGFCFSFALCLLNKLKRMKAEGRIFEEGTYPMPQTGISRVVTHYLNEQIGGTNYDTVDTEEQLSDLIKIADEFLDIFVAYPAPLPPNDSRHSRTRP